MIDTGEQAGGRLLYRFAHISAGSLVLILRTPITRDGADEERWESHTA